MATRHEVEVTEAVVADGRFRTRCACTCGWQGGTDDEEAAAALSAAARTRLEHLLEAHPRQTPSAFLRPRASARYHHPRSISAAARTPNGKRWTRTAACACGWTTSVRGRNPRQAAHRARERHHAHVDLRTGGTPTRDYLLMGALVVGIGALVVLLLVVAIRAAGGDVGTFLG